MNYSPGWALDNGDSAVLDCLVQVPHETKLDVVRRVIGEDGESVRGCERETGIHPRPQNQPRGCGTNEAHLAPVNKFTDLEALLQPRPPGSATIESIPLTTFRTTVPMKFRFVSPSNYRSSPEQISDYHSSSLKFNAVSEWWDDYIE